ncbi:tetratricopeptide repeat protein [Planktotalea arctica]|uniref:tetratricopeptide repeat protein n=1 Tax=Planktotalea arctica TaxID=1481893 RepID=UPI000A16D2A7|nr:tetratricopeptide repeat protein [Planktotalea arctica]
MIELGTSTAPAAGDLIKDVNENTFMKDVVEASDLMPVIVDFWAPWCGPCKTLGPALEAEVMAANGAVKMAKIDVDQNQMIAGQMQIQSIPAVFAFYKGQPIDGFQGALPPSEIKAFVARVIEAGGGDASGGLNDAIEAAEAMLDEGEASDAAQTFAAILEEDDQCAAAYAGLARAHLALDEADQAEAVLNGVPVEISTDAMIEAAFAQLALARQAAEAGPLAELAEALEANPEDNQARFDLAVALNANGQTQEAVDALLEIFRRDREWNEGAAKTQLFTIFDSLKPEDSIVLNGRRKLSSMIFA